MNTLHQILGTGCVMAMLLMIVAAVVAAMWIILWAICRAGSQESPEQDGEDYGA